MIASRLWIWPREVRHLANAYEFTLFAATYCAIAVGVTEDRQCKKGKLGSKEKDQRRMDHLENEGYLSYSDTVPRALVPLTSTQNHYHPTGLVLPC